MYKISHENDDIVIRFEKDLVDEETFSRFLGHINYQSMLKKTKTTDVTRKLRDKNRLTAFPMGLALIRDPDLNKGTAFSEEERLALGISGLLPPRVHSLDEQV